MKQDLPNLVDERRLRRTREPDDIQRDERGRVSPSHRCLKHDGGCVLDARCHHPKHHAWGHGLSH